MGRRGPPPKPRKFKLLEGTFRRDRASKAIPKPPPGAKPPPWLTAGAKREWKRIGPWLEAQGLLTITSQTAFASYCFWADQFEKIGKECQKVGLAVSIHEGYRNALAKASMEMRQQAARFGLSPADLERIGVEPQTPPPAPGTPPDQHPEDQIFGRSRRA